jgi:co-chaperonin GroES (HSP10)
MKACDYVVVKAKNAYNNEVEIGGIKAVVNSSIESVEHINRIAEVITAPESTGLLPGDEVIIHHNIMRQMWGQSGKLVYSEYWITEDQYFVPVREVFMFKRNGVWKSIDPYCFVKPLTKEDEVKNGVFMFGEEDSHKGKQKLTGSITYPNKSLQDQGINPRDIVYFTKWSEYEFMIDGELHYKMATKDIIAVEC